MISYADYLRLLPKTELHCHFASTMSAELFIELAAKHGVELPTTDPDELFDFAHLVDFLVAFRFAHDVLRDPEDFERVAYAGVAEAVADGNLRDFGVGFRGGVAINRRADAASAVDLVREMIAHPRPEVVGLGQDDLTPENTEDPGRFVEAYELAREHGFLLTAHVGETDHATPDAVRVAIEELGCDRLDHGYRIVDDPEIVALARDRGIGFAATPLSTTICSGWTIDTDHRIRRMIDAGLAVNVSTDDAMFFRTDIGREYTEGLRLMGVTADEAKQIALNGIDAAFCDDAQKARLRADFRAAFRALDAALEP